MHRIISGRNGFEGMCGGIKCGRSLVVFVSLAFLQNQTLCGFFYSPPVLRAFVFKLSVMTSSWRLASEPPISHKHRIKVWKVETLLQKPIFVQAILAQAILLQTKEHFLAFFVVVYLLPTMARGGQLRRRTTLSCLHFSIQAGMSTHSYSMSVSLRLAKRSGSTSIRHHPFILLCFFFLQIHERNFNQEG